MNRELSDITWGPLARFSLRLNNGMIDINRTTESLIDVLSSCGGLLRALMVILNVVVGPYNRYVLHSLLTLNLVRFVPSLHKGVQ